MRALLMVVLAALVSTACAASGAHPRPFPTPDDASTWPDRGQAPISDAAVATGYEVSGTALALRGVPYRNGGADPTGFDCSGLVWYVFGRHGLSLPRRVEDQYRAGGSVAPADLQAGDLVFFSTTSSGASHVGIIVGGDSFVHAPSSSGVVRVERLSSSYWSARFLGARRLLGA